MFEQTFRNIDNVLWKEAGCASELDYTEQTSWMLFLKYLDDLEFERSQEAELRGQSYEFIIDEAHRWSRWAAPKNADGNFDHDSALTGDDLVKFVSFELFPYLHGFKERAASTDTIEYKIGEIFGEIRNKFSSGYSLRDALELIDELSFGSQAEKHEQIWVQAAVPKEDLMHQSCQIYQSRSLLSPNKNASSPSSMKLSRASTRRSPTPKRTSPMLGSCLRVIGPQCTAKKVKVGLR